MASAVYGYARLPGEGARDQSGFERQCQTITANPTGRHGYETEWRWEAYMIELPVGGGCLPCPAKPKKQ